MTPHEAGLLLIAEGERLMTAGRAMLDPRVTRSRVECAALPDPPAAGHNASMPILLSVAEAAEMMSLTEAAFRTRLNRGQVSGVVRTGRKIQIHRERFLAGLAKSREGRT